MAKNFSDLKKNRDNNDKLASLVTKMNSESSGTYTEDTRFWKLEADKAGNGNAIIRFLDEAPNEDIVWVKIYTHEFQGPGGWYIDKCLTTVGGECPICAANSELWRTGTTENQNIVRTRKRKLRYISNILVIKDSAHPENEGKVFLFRYGTKIYNKIKECMKPQFEDEVARNPFDMWVGCNFRLRQTLEDGYPNYNSSKFDDPSPIAKDDNKIKEIWESQHSLIPFYEEIKQIDPNKQAERMKKVLREGGSAVQASGGSTVHSANSAPTRSTVQNLLDAAADVSEDGLDLDYFRKLAED